MLKTPEISILMPAIRTHNWERMYFSIEQSCPNHSWELVIASPFDLPDSLKAKTNIVVIKDYGCPSRAVQLGLLKCNGKLVYHCVDDAIFFKDAISTCIEFYKKSCTSRDIVNMRYREGENWSAPPMPDNYWNIWTHGPNRLPAIDPNWLISMHFIMDLNSLKDMGGWDCQFEYIVHPQTDLCCRIQGNDGRIINSPVEATLCNWYPGTSVDHKPIHDAQIYFDTPIFNRIYSQDKSITKSRFRIDINNWQQQPDVWTRRFNSAKLETTYNELPKFT